MSRYGGDHAALRRAALPFAYGKPCARCGRPMRPGQAIELDHADDGAGYLGFSHARCNRQAGGRLGRARQIEQQRRKRVMSECALGIEIAEDRRHTSIVAAGVIGEDSDEVLVDLVAYLDGPNATATVLGLRAERTVVAVAVDPHSPGATLIKPLTEAGVQVAEPSTSDVVVAHGDFLDILAAGRLRHAGQAELTAAVRAGTQRPAGGAVVWARRGETVDGSPLRAATLALWAWTHRPPAQGFMAAWA